MQKNVKKSCSDPVLDPEQPDLLADQVIWTELEDPSRLATVVVQIAHRSLAAANRVGKSLWERKKYQLAVQLYSDLTTIATNSAVLWCNLGLAYEATDDKKRAADCLGRALDCDPLNDGATRAVHTFRSVSDGKDIHIGRGGLHAVRQ